MYKLFTFIAILAITTLACGINIPKPPQPDPEQTEEISMEYPESDEINLNLNFGAGELKIAPGAEELFEGTATYNYREFAPTMSEENGNITLRVGDEDFRFISGFNNPKNEWDLKLGKKPMELNLEAGAYEGEIELGGLALTRLNITDGASTMQVSFSEPNAVEMSTFTYSTGASTVSLIGLANANFALMDFSSGAGDYTLDFSGELTRDTSVKIESGLSSIALIIPESVQAEITVQEGLSTVHAGSGWQKVGNLYTQEGQGPTLTIVVEMGAGTLTLMR